MRLSTWLTVLLVLAAAGGCRKKTVAVEEAGVAAASSAAAPAASAAPAAVDAANVGQVARFQDEVKVDNEVAPLLSWVSVQKTPTGGDAVTSLQKGTETTKIAQRGTFFLVTFANPKTPTERLMGWISESGYKVQVVARDAGPAAQYTANQKIKINWKGSVYPGVITQVVGKDQYKIHYDGYGNEWDEVIGPNRIMGKR